MEPVEHSKIGSVPAQATGLLNEARNALSSSSILCRHPKLELYLETLHQLESSLGEETTRAMLPAFKDNPILVSGILHEVGNYIHENGAAGDLTAEDLMREVPLLAITHQPYQQIFLDDLKSLWSGSREDVIAELSSFGGLNGTLRNWLVASRLQEGLFADPALGVEAKVTLATYSWNEWFSKVRSGICPDLPNGTGDFKYLKFLVEFEIENGPSTFADYGSVASSVRRQTGVLGEGLGLCVGQPVRDCGFNPLDMSEVRKAASEIIKSQGAGTASNSLHRAAVEIPRLHDELMKLISGRDFPQDLVGIRSLNPTHLDSALKFTEIMGRMLEQWERASASTSRRMPRSPCIFAGLGEVVILASMEQPSTRTRQAVDIAASFIGGKVIWFDSKESSFVKKESPQSFELYLKSQAVDCIAVRTDNLGFWKGFCAKEKERTLLCLGAKEGHVTQTLAELRYLLKEYGCSSLDELRERTKDNPPSVVVIGHTSEKRADMEFLRALKLHLPDWRVVNIVPDAKYACSSAAEDTLLSGVEVVIDNNLKDASHVRDLFSHYSPSFIYTSNVAATAKTAKEQVEAVDTDFCLAPSMVEDLAITPKIFHPLPASDEVDAGLMSLNSPFTATMIEVMQIKERVAAGLIALSVASQRGRRLK